MHDNYFIIWEIYHFGVNICCFLLIKEVIALKWEVFWTGVIRLKWRVIGSSGDSWSDKVWFMGFN